VILYVDTSALVKLLVVEVGTPTMLELWRRADRVTSSWLAYPETRAALTAASRLGRIDLARAVAASERLLRVTELIEPAPRLLRRAAHLAQTHALGGYDAVHLASAEAAAGDDFVFACADKRLDEAARDAGLSTAAWSA
jgi:predicted nucleic acid-binding protein